MKTALFLLLAGGWSTVLPGSVHALGGPFPITVSVEGEVRRPGAFTLPHNATLSSLLLAAGGFTDNADLRGAALVRASVRAAQEEELKSTAAKLSLEADGSGETGDALRPVAALLLTLRPRGRVPVRVTLPRLLKNSPDDLRLEGGDALRVPARADTVAVAGAVRAASDNVPFSPDRPFEEYVRHAGGYAEDADSGRGLPPSGGRDDGAPDPRVHLLESRGCPLGGDGADRLPSRHRPGRHDRRVAVPVPRSSVENLPEDFRDPDARRRDRRDAGGPAGTGAPVKPP